MQDTTNRFDANVVNVALSAIKVIIDRVSGLCTNLFEYVLNYRRDEQRRNNCVHATNVGEHEKYYTGCWYVKSIIIEISIIICSESFSLGLFLLFIFTLVIGIALSLTVRYRHQRCVTLINNK